MTQHYGVYTCCLPPAQEPGHRCIPGSESVVGPQFVLHGQIVVERKERPPDPALPLIPTL